MEAELAIRHGASALGLVSNMPSGPGIISEDLIATITSAVADRAETILLTSETSPDLIAGQVDRTGVSGVQLCAWLDDNSRSALRHRLPHLMLMQVVHVTDESALARAESGQRHVDRLLLDSGTLVGPIRELGGTGRTHDWSISRRIVDNVHVPVLLAGGLGPTNVWAALGEVQPFGLDVCSGVRTNGSLDDQLLASFFEAARSDDER